VADERYGEVRIETVPPLHVACYRAVSQSPEDDVSRFMQNWIKEHKLQPPARTFGFDVEVAPEQQQGGLRGYELWTSVPAGTRPAGGVTIRDFAGGLYAVMTIRDPFTKPFDYIPSGWQVLWKWVQGSTHYRPVVRQMLEEVVEREGRKDLDVFCAVEPQTAS
jgi:DNA gyrase inhibitor GyrI